MSNLPRHAIILVLSLGAGFFSANSQTKPAVKPSSVSGRVTIHGKSAPGVIVGIRQTERTPAQGPALKATTDQDGNYRIKDVPPGKYQVGPMSPVYVEPNPSSADGRGSSQGRGKEKSLMLGEGEDVSGIDFSLERGGVITGKITDADDRPVVEERVTVVSADYVEEPNRRFPPVGTGGFVTDDRGVYRIFGIPEGRYKIYVGQGGENVYSSPGFVRVAYRRTFFPDAADSKAAQIVEVGEGTEAKEIDIKVGRSLSGFVVSGRVIDGETGQPIAGLRIGLRRIISNGMAPNTASTPSNSQGEFRLENLTPSKYAVWILPVQGNEALADAVPFEVIDQDVTGLVIKTSKGLTISGNLVIDGESDRNLLAKIAQLRLFSYVRNENAISSYGRPAVISADGSFRVAGLGAGTAHFSLGSQDNLPLVNFSILRVERDGIVQPRGMEIKAGENITGVKIVLIYGTGSVRGEVKLENGPLPENSRIVLRLRKANAPEQNFRMYEVDARGHFLIEGIPAGEYTLHVQANLPDRRRLPSSDQPISVIEGKVVEVSVTLDLGVIPGQTPTP
jgi:protocatechuate 3,4-dioxygenase beta subunit